jgi:hypothetical protein
MHLWTKHIVVVLVALALFVGWAGQAISFAISGSCIASMATEKQAGGEGDSGENSLTSPDADKSHHCLSVMLRCLNSLGCIQMVGLPQSELGVAAVHRVEGRVAWAHRDMPGITIKPELSPPKHLI